LERQNYGYTFVDYKSTVLYVLMKAILSCRVLHYHISNPILLLGLTLCGRLLGKRVILTLHGNYGRYGWIRNYLVRLSISIATVPIVINDLSYKRCRLFNKQTTLIPAFLPPQKEEVLQRKILELLQCIRSKGKQIISTNAYNISYDKKGNDTYGIDFLVSYFKDEADIVLVVSDPSGNYKKKNGEKEEKVCEGVYFTDFPHPYYELLKNVDYFVRNTSTDGDALSVKESLYLGVPTHPMHRCCRQTRCCVIVQIL